MADPVDIESCFGAMNAAKDAYNRHLIDKEFLEESLLLLKLIARKYMRVLNQGKPRADDVD